MVLRRTIAFGVILSLIGTWVTTSSLAASVMRQQPHGITTIARPARGGADPIHQLTIPLVDLTRPTVAHGVELSPSRALTTLVWVPRVPGRRPLIVFAPGFSVGPDPYKPLLEAWASQGNVVAAIEFPLTDGALAGSNLDEGDIQNQPADVNFVTEALLGSFSPVAASIDPEQIALAGHSDGGETVLADTFDPGQWTGPAVRAVIAMSVRPLITTARAANPPILVIQGDADSVNAPSNAEDAYDLAAPPKYLAMLHGGDHLAPFEAGSPWFSSIVGLTETFLTSYLGNDGSSSAVLAAGNQALISTSNAD